MAAIDSSAAVVEEPFTDRDVIGPKGRGHLGLHGSKVDESVELTRHCLRPHEEP
jgi:hypothetical protein